MLKLQVHDNEMLHDCYQLRIDNGNETNAALSYCDERTQSMVMPVAGSLSGIV